MTTYQELAHDLQTRSFARVPFPLSYREIANVVEGPFYDFLRLRVTDEERKRLHYKLPINFRGGNIGSYKRSRDHDGDRKELFHYHLEAERQFADVRREYPAFDRLLRAMRPLYEATSESFRSVLSLFEPEFPGVLKSFFPDHRDPHLFLRIIAYKKGENRLAKRHLDMSGLTKALAESGPGLEGGFDDDHMFPITHVEHEAVVFPGLTFMEETCDDYSPTWHGVNDAVSDEHSAFSEEARAKYITSYALPVLNALNDDEVMGPDDVARWAVVGFASGEKIRYSDIGECNSPHAVSIQRARALDAGWQPQLLSRRAAV